MPQLNPAPWLLVFLLSWLMFIILLSKILKNTYQPQASTTDHTLLLNNWSWPWY